MTKVSYKLTENNGCYYFNDGTGDVRVKPGFSCHSCLLQGDTITLDDCADELPHHVCFLPFIDPILPIFQGKCNGKVLKCALHFGIRFSRMNGVFFIGENMEKSDSGFCYCGNFELGEDFHFKGHFELAFGIASLLPFAQYNVDCFFGNEIFEQYDLFISSIPEKRGLAILKKDDNGKKLI